MTPNEMQRLLAAPFPADEIGWKPQAVAKDGKRALAVPYIDARSVMDRLDQVCGIGGWQDEYHVLDNGSVMCRLKVLVGESWVVREDVGAQSEQPDGGDRMKAAWSDALKRAAVKFGIGRYLYSVPPIWADYDSQKRQFVSEPRLPVQFLPEHAKPVQPQPPKAAANGNGKPDAATITKSQADGLVAKLHDAGVSHEALFKQFGITRLGQLTIEQFREAITWVDDLIEEKAIQQSRGE